jgi:tetratricopeptide (TPR) repeat protein
LFEAGEVRVDPAEGWYTRYDDTTTDYAELPLPASVVDAVRARVARLGSAARRVLETAALADDGCTLDELKGATALTDWEALDGLERAIDAHVMNRDGGGYRFVHDLFRTAIRSGLSPERQRLTHAKLATALEPLKTAAARVAAHWQAAGENRAAAAAWVRAAEEAAAVFAQVEASGHYERAALLTTNDEAAFALQDRSFDHLSLSSLDRERRAMLDRLLAWGQQSRSPLVRLEVLISAAQSATLDCDYERSERFALQALQAVQAIDPPNDLKHLHALEAAGIAAGNLDRRAEALARFHQGHALAQRQAHDVGQFLVLMPAAASFFAVLLNRLDEATVLHDEALKTRDAKTHSVAMAISLTYCSHLMRALGKRDEAVAELRQAVAIGRSARAHSYMREPLVDLCETLIDDGRLGDACAVQPDLHSVFPDATEPLARYSTSRTAAAVHELQGDLGGAMAAARASLNAADDLGGLNFRRDARFRAARLMALAGASALARPWVDEAETMVHQGWSGSMLAAACFHASLLVEQDPAAASARLRTAIAEPFADVAMHLHLGAARILLARCELALGHPETARDIAATVHHSVALESQAIAVQIEAARHDGHGLQAAVDAGMALIDRACLPPAHALALMRVLSGDGSNGAGKRHPLARLLRPRMHAVAQSLADSLCREPALQSAWIRQHRDLLT